MLEPSLSVSSIKAAGSVIKALVKPIFNEYKEQKVVCNALHESYDEINKKEVENIEQIFSRDKMTGIESYLKGVRGYDVEGVLREALKLCCSKEELGQKSTLEIIDEFIIVFKEKIKQHDRTLYNEIFLQQISDQVEHVEKVIVDEIQGVNGSLGIIEKKLDTRYNYQTLEAIERELKSSSDYSIDLDFFDYEDKEVDDNLSSSLLTNKNTFVKCKFVEEGLYYVLRLLKQKHISNVFIVKDIVAWKQIVSEYDDAVLIQYFSNDSTFESGNNKVIKILYLDEFTASKNVIEIRQRLRINLENKLHKYVNDDMKVLEIIDQSVCSYPGLKHQLFTNNGFSLKFVLENKSICLPILLLDKWKEFDGDKQLIEELTGLQYNDFILRAKCVKNIQNPFIVSYMTYHSLKYKVVDSYMAWKLMVKDITVEDLTNYGKAILKILLDDKKDDAFRDNNLIDAGEYTDTIKEGMLKSLVMLSWLSEDSHVQLFIQEIVNEALNKIETVKAWKHISKHLPLLAEAAPVQVLEHLKNEINMGDSGLWEILNFKENEFGVLNYRHRILVTLEVIMHNNFLLKRGIDVLIQLYLRGNKDDKQIKDIIECLDKIFNLKISEMGLNIQTKNILLKYVCSNEELGWRLLKTVLPSNENRVRVYSLSKNQYKPSHAIIPLERKEQKLLIEGYFRIALELIGNDLKKLEYLLFHTYYFYYGNLDEIYDKINDLLSDESICDEDKIYFENGLRGYVYRYKLYSNASQYYDTVINRISYWVDVINYSNAAYKYLYAFQGGSIFVLNPDDSMKDYENQLDFISKKQIEILEGNSKSAMFKIEDLIKIAGDVYKIGENIAKVQGKNTFDKAIVESICNVYKFNILAGYMRFIYRNKNLGELKDFLQDINQDEIKARVLAVIEINEELVNLMEMEIQNQSIYWESVSLYELNGTLEFRIKCIRKVIENKSFDQAYRELTRKRDETDDVYPLKLYLYFLEGYKESDVVNDWRIKQIFKNIYGFNMNSEEKKEVGSYEYIYMLFFDDDDSGVKPKYLYEEIHKSPTMLAEMILCLFDEHYENKKNVSLSLFEFIETHHFCPCMHNGNIDVIELRRWCKDFLACFEKKNLLAIGYNYLGRILADYSSDDKVEIPKQAVCEIIEEFHNEGLFDGYIIQKYNRRGVHELNNGYAELELNKQCEKVAEDLAFLYPYTAQIYTKMSVEHKNESKIERERGCYE